MPRSRRIVNAAWAAMPAVLAACAHFTPEPLVPERSATQLESRTLAGEGLRGFIEKSLDRRLSVWPLQHWDLNLLTLAAFYYHPTLDLARAQWAAAQAATLTAGARPNPTLALTPEYVTTPPSGVAVGIDLPLETAGKRKHRIEAAQQRSVAARWDVLSEAWRVRQTVRSAAIGLSGSAERVRLLNEQLRIQEEIILLLEQRLTAGAVAGSDVTLARAQAAKTRLDLQTARIEQADARAKVAEALAVPASAIRDVALDVELDRGGAQALASTEVRANALRSRTDILSALAEYAAAQAALQLEIAKQYPDVHLMPGYQWDQGENKWSLGLTLELPVLNRNQGPIAEAEAHRNEVAARFRVLQTQVIGQIDQAVATLEAAEQAEQSGRALSAVQQDRLRAVEAQLAAGAVDTLDVASARLDLTATEQLALEARIREQQALSALEDAVQRPLGAEDLLLKQIESTQHSPHAAP